MADPSRPRWSRWLDPRFPALLLALVALVLGGLGASAVLGPIYQDITLGTSDVIGLIYIVLALIAFIAALGAWGRKRWGRILALVVSLVYAIPLTSGMVNGSSANFSISIVALVMLWALTVATLTSAVLLVAGLLIEQPEP